jgi:hypothetical protein
MPKASRTVSGERMPHETKPAGDRVMAPDQIDGALHEIASMVEFLYREMEKRVCDEKTKAFSIPYDDMNLIDFAICDINRRVKELRGSIRH